MSAVAEAACDELGKGSGAVADLVLAIGLDLAKGLRATFWHEDRVVAKAALAARRPDEPARSLAAEQLEIAVGPGERQHRDKGGAPVAVAEFALHPRHGGTEILGRARPAGRVHARRAVECRDDEAGIV